MPEVAGHGALLIDPFDVQAIRAAVKKVIGDPSLREKLVKKGLQNIERFSAQEIARQYCQLYKKVLNDE